MTTAGIAMHNLIHDKHKLGLALVGIIFSVILITLELGLLLNALHNASGLVDNAGADVWIMQTGTRNVDQPEIMSERLYYQAIALKGVAWAERLIIQFCPWKLIGGQQSAVEVMGIEPQSRLNLPWGMAVGKREEILNADGIIIDERERKRFANHDTPLQINDHVEIAGRRARIAGFSQGVGTFTLAPYVFTSYKQAQDYAKMKEKETKYVVVKAIPGVSPIELRDRLRDRLNNVDIYTTEEFSAKTRFHWLINTGLGLGVIAAALVSCVVGIVIVGQTMYSATIERLHEYGTLKAIGMSNRSLAGIVICQAIMTGLLGYAAGGSVAYFVGNQLPSFNIPVEVPLSVLAWMFIVAIGMCVLASVTSIVRVFKLEPAIVFRT